MKDVDVVDKSMIYMSAGVASGAIGAYLSGYPDVSGYVLITLAYALIAIGVLLALGELAKELVAAVRRWRGENA